MKVVVTAFKEVWGLFVDDVRLAIALVVWCGFVLFGGFSALRAPEEWRGPLLFLGCLAILVLDAADSARRLRGPQPPPV